MVPYAQDTWRTPLSDIQREKVLAATALTSTSLYLCLNDGKNRQTALEAAESYAMIMTETVNRWEREFLTHGRIKVSKPGRYEKHFILGLEETT